MTRKIHTQQFAALGLYMPKNPDNVGSALRAAHCYDAALINMQGRRFGKARTDVTQAWQHIPLLQVPDLLEAIPFGAVPVAIEFVQTATPLPEFRHPAQAYYLFGPEDGSLPKEVVSKCKHVVYVPTTVCMNLAACVNVVLYDRMAKLSQSLS